MMTPDRRSPAPATRRMLARGIEGEETLHRASLIIVSKRGHRDPREAYGDIE
jgi:hypothetical protein